MRKTHLAFYGLMMSLLAMPAAAFAQNMGALQSTPLTGQTVASVPLAAPEQVSIVPLSRARDNPGFDNGRFADGDGDHFRDADRFHAIRDRDHFDHDRFFADRDRRRDFARDRIASGDRIAQDQFARQSTLIDDINNNAAGRASLINSPTANGMTVSGRAINAGSVTLGVNANASANNAAAVAAANAGIGVTPPSAAAHIGTIAGAGNVSAASAAGTGIVARGGVAHIGARAAIAHGRR